MAEIGRLSVKVPIKFSEKAQRDLYEICMAYKKLAEMRGTENDKLRELAGLLLYGMHHDAPPHEELLWSQRVNRLTDELGIEEDE